MLIANLDVVTVVHKSDRSIRLTAQSLIDVAIAVPTFRLRWIVKVQPESCRAITEAIRYVRSANLPVVVVEEGDSGIYEAMNQALTRVESSWFLLLNSGDMLRTEKVDTLRNLKEDYVHCFRSVWHDEAGADLSGPRNLFVPYLAKMPNHQAMVFPRRFSTWPYDDGLKLYADQDMKLCLWRLNLLHHHNEVLVSSLKGGLTTQVVPPSLVIRRARESARVFDRHFVWPHAKFLALAYAVKGLLSWAAFKALRRPLTSQEESPGEPTAASEIVVPISPKRWEA